MTTRFAFACCVVVLSPLFAAEGQVIRVKTLPVAESEQFSFLPSAGMAGVSIALADTLLDPFLNPAKGSRLKSSQYFGAPSFFSVSANSGAGTTFPLGAMWKRGSSFASLSAAFQKIHRPENTSFAGSFRSIDGPFVSPPPAQPTPSTSNNSYTLAFFGHRLDSARLSFGVGALWSGLGAVDGVEQFYHGNDWLRQKGEARDLRLGVLKEWQRGSSLEAVVVYNHFDHGHDAGFTDLFWSPAQRQTIGRPRTEHGGEDTETWGLQVEYERPVVDSTWRAGVTMTVNRISHGRIPSYELFRGMGTTGFSTAFNGGVGVSKLTPSYVIGADLLYEPITSTTRAGDSVTNRFSFSNARLRGGVSRTFALADPGSSFSIQLGTELYSVSYAMNQRDHVSGVARVRKEAWLEQLRTAGMSFRVPGVEVHYHVRTRIGVGRPGVVVTSPNTSPPIVFDDLSSAPWMLPQPSASALGPVRVAWHQFAISIPHR
ncbi:MAG: hypothetical protein ACRENU_04990 [Gemmatimonadaceae bacterium]